MWRKIVCMLSLVSVFLLGGCASHKPVDRDVVQTRKKSLRNTMQKYAAAVRDDSVNGIMKLVTPAIESPHRRALQNRISRVLWLRQYTGYRIDVSRTLSNVEVRKLVEHSLKVRVAGKNSRGELFWDSLKLIRKDDRWLIYDLALQTPKRGEVLDIPQKEIKKIMSRISPLMRALKKEKMGQILSLLPDTDAALTRTSDPGWLGSLLGMKGQTYAIIEDIERVCQFSFSDWPDEGDKPIFIYVGPDTVMALYDVPYTWQQGGIYDDELRIEILVTSVQDQWQIELLRFFGQGIDGTQ